MTVIQTALRNKLLKSLLPEDFSSLMPHLELKEFELRQQLEEPGVPIKEAVFLESGIASIVAKSPKGRDIEIGLTGFEGVTGTSLLLGVHMTSHWTYMQLAGAGYAIAAEHLITAVAQSATLRQHLLLFVECFIVQAAATSLVNAQAQAETKLARWLLMVHDRSHGHELYLTHEFMAVMLGVRRPWVTETLHVLEGKGFIRAARGKVTVLDRQGLIIHSGGFYGAAERAYKKLFSKSDHD
ncbi:MAG: Crp/Fnr family transcriptional regulator [Phyllobacterium sp.]|uniref:Crp/Fnr family transcriptional regulator n=1 Tax=Phyllobacterium sp. TaxID=1871046 RepID=UPI0030F01DC1